jgi:hypothetical protein
MWYLLWPNLVCHGSTIDGLCKDDLLEKQKSFFRK